MKTLLIITGPQGSGNHLFSKIFAATPGVTGWSELNDKYWVPHKDEPFAEAWTDPSKLKDISFDKYAVTSISCPFVGSTGINTPRYIDFINEAKSLGYKIKLAIIGRDQNILRLQQQRIRGRETLDMFESRVPDLLQFGPCFLSTELLYLYKSNYLKTISKQLEFPIWVSREKLDEILATDSNAKYMSQCDLQPLDMHVININKPE